LTLGYPVACHRLGNGLRVVVSEDHAAASVTVHVHYDAGSRDERPGRSGLAHLLEHLMFVGSRNAGPGEHAGLLAACGGRFNGGTAADRTVYFEHLPAGAAELALWLEADRMATLHEMLSQELLDTQRAVVIQEKYQRYDNVPYGDTDQRLLALVYPSGHPYHHPVSGSVADLRAVTLDDVRGFFRACYAPGNAVLAVTGDVVAKQVLAAAERYFGPVPAGPARPRIPAVVLEPAAGPARDDAAGAVPSAMTTAGFRLPANSVTDPGILACDLALRILAGGTPSRLHRVLTDELQAAREVRARTAPRTRGNSLGVITVPAMPGAGGAVIEKALADELARLGGGEPGEDELACARAGAERELLAALSASTGRAAALAYHAAAFGDPGLINTAASRIAAITPAQVRQAAATWLRPQCAAIVTTRPAPPPGGRPSPKE